ncbi:MAG: hypothetical protein MH321_12785 [Leptospiraceae bacterium]|nr:hypothetical protein [Leptospiraceae bacterium]
MFQRVDAKLARRQKSSFDSSSKLLCNCLEGKFKIFTLYLLFLFCFSACKDRDSEFFLANSNSIPQLIRLDYGLELLDEGERNPEGILNLKPSFEFTESTLCFHSRNRSEIDYGPRLSFCLENSLFNKKIMEDVQLAFENPLNTNSFPNFIIHSHNLELRIDFPTESSIIREWKKVPANNWLLLDESFLDRLEEKRSIQLDGTEFHLGKSYSLPYWNYMESNSCSFLIRSWNLDVSKSSRRFLRISFPCDYISPMIRKFIESSKMVNEKSRTNCTNREIVIQEIFQSTSSRMNRFIEWKNPHKEAICLDELVFLQVPEEESNSKDELSNSKQVRIQFWDNSGLGFLFPSAHLLFIHEDSDLEGKMIPASFPWNDLQQGKPSFLALQKEVEKEILPKIDSLVVNFKEEDEYFSQDLNLPACADQRFLYTSSEKACASPGYSLPRSSSSHFCKPIDLQLTEIQARGVLDSELRSFTQDRFLEFQVRTKDGRSSCDISALFLKIGRDAFPLSALRKILNNNEVFLISLSKKLPQQNFQISRSLSRLNWQSDITLYDLKKEEVERNFRNSSEPRFVDHDSNGNLYSLEWKTEVLGKDAFIHHLSTPGWVSSSKYEGNESKLPGFDPGIQLTELLWSGSFQNSISILEDRFIEWKSESGQPASLLLELEFPGFPSRSQSYLIPNQVGTYTLSRSELVCFPKKNSLIHRDFNLFQSNTRMRIRDPISNSIHDEVLISTSQFGMNSTSLRIRRSAVKNLNTQTWQSSDIDSSFCLGQTFASPGENP